MNVCKNCVFWQYCLQYRYKNIQKDYMKKVRRKPNDDGNLVIYVEECVRHVKFKPFKGSITHYR